MFLRHDRPYEIQTAPAIKMLILLTILHCNLLVPRSGNDLSLNSSKQTQHFHTDQQREYPG